MGLFTNYRAEVEILKWDKEKPNLDKENHLLEWFWKKMACVMSISKLPWHRLKPVT